MGNKLITTSSEWSVDLLERFDKEIGRIAEKYALDTYPLVLEIITSARMLDAYSSVGMPINYHHWSFGKSLVINTNQYNKGYMGLAYEIVINSNPCIAYLMEENTMMMQALVIAHAGYGHNSFFKGNYLFRKWTDAAAIVDYLVYAKSYIADCEERYGVREVELLLDSCHALMNYGVDRYRRPPTLSVAKEKERQRKRQEAREQDVNLLWKTVPKKEEKVVKSFPLEPEENILYFLEKHAPLLEDWQREVVRIVRKIAQYFYPQTQTKVMNEGWATFWHYTIMQELYEEGLISEGFMLEFLQSHTNVILQPAFNSPFYSGINPYALGFAMMSDIRRICENPTMEDRKWFPDIAGSNWVETLDYAMRNFRDESFILQFLSPKVMRDFRLFSVYDDVNAPTMKVDAIHNERGYRTIREHLASSYDLGYHEPNVQVVKADLKGDRTLVVRHTVHSGRPLNDDMPKVLSHLGRLWRFNVILEELTELGSLRTLATFKSASP